MRIKLEDRNEVTYHLLTELGVSHVPPPVGFESHALFKEAYIMLRNLRQVILCGRVHDGFRWRLYEECCPNPFQPNNLRNEDCMIMSWEDSASQNMGRHP
mmetsp:Transcript_20714/g.19757  ORF Transcript_20714/g.19757 Transcript_20714/m.19757 type:complete len:100 (-) Transcript_20714:718-1017(-)